MTALHYQPGRLFRLWPAFLVSILFLISTAQAAQLTLSTEPLDPRAEGYHIYKRLTGENYDYQQPAWSGKESSCTIDNLVEGKTYYFVARSFTGSEQSVDSNEIEYIVQGSDLPLLGDDNTGSEVDIIDDGAPETSFTGTWKVSGGANPYGSQSLYSRDPGASYHFYVTPDKPGSYTVAIRWTYYSNRCSAVPVRIYDGALLLDTVTVDQQYTSGQWNTIGTYSFSDQAQVVVAAQSDACSTCADAAKFTLEVNDSDGDGVIDTDDAFPADSQEWHDADGDGIGDNADSDDDNDGMPDQWETLYGLNLFVDDALKDLDADGVVNIDEYTGDTNPAKKDSDGDGAGDAADPFPTDASEWGDSDGDGVGDNADTDDDNDGMPDAWEVLYGLDPKVNDALKDLDGDGVVNFDEYTGSTNPAKKDSDGDGAGDGVDPFPTDAGEWSDSDGDGMGDNVDIDDDNDGMPDKWEMLYGLDPMVNDALLDKDGDGIVNIEEYINGSDPNQSNGAGTIIIDDGGPGTASMGNWKISGGADPYGSQSLYSTQAGAQYAFESMVTGRYEIALWWTYYSTRSTSVPVQIYDGDLLLETVTVDQQQNCAQWNVLGTYDFRQQVKVVVLSEDDASTSADAAKFTVVEEAGPVIIDDGDVGALSSGVWKVSGGADPYGDQSLYSREAGATFSYEAPLSGRYEVALWWTYYFNRCSDVEVEIFDGDRLLETLSVDQLQQGGQWVVLGAFDFTVSARVVITAQSAECSTSADAVAFIPVKEVIIDDGDAAALSSGVWKVSGGADPYGAQSLYSRDVGAAYEYHAPLTGLHNVSLWWSSHSTRCNSVVVEIYDGDLLLDTVAVNQQQNSGMWNALGNYAFSAKAAVVVVAESESCSTAADAVRFETTGF
jgi:hypothetical protein